MAYNTLLTERIRNLLARRQGVDERIMFGGVTLMGVGVFWMLRIARMKM